MKNSSRYAEYVPVALVIVGFLLIGLGWNGAASLDYTQGQIPYMISGGLAGLALVFFGSASMVVRAMRSAEINQTERLDRIAQSLSDMKPVWAADGNGNGGRTKTEAALVVAGASSFHLPSCRLVEGRTDAPQVPREKAEAEGLQPCRICRP